MTSRDHAEIPVTKDNLWFLERYLNLFDVLDLFPMDAISPSETERGNPIVLRTDLGFDIVSDIDRTKMQLRNRSKVHGWTRWTKEKAIVPGDRIIIRRINEREYSLTCLRSTVSDAGI
jgi:hypothetical protein